MNYDDVSYDGEAIDFPTENVDMEVFPNSGCAYAFYPFLLIEDERQGDIIPEIERSNAIGWLDLAGFGGRHNRYRKIDGLPERISGHWHEGWDDKKQYCRYVRVRFTNKKFLSSKIKGYEVNVAGLEIAFETTTENNEEAERRRGFIHSTNVICEDDPRYRENQPPSVYHHYRVGDVFAFEFEFEDEMPFNATSDGTPVPVKPRFKINVKFKRPDSLAPLEADLVVDIGNTRTVAMLIKHGDKNAPKDISSIRDRCRPVMLCLDYRNAAVLPSQAVDISNGIVSSWFVLHEPEFSSFETEKEDGLPALVQSRYETRLRKRFFRKPIMVNVGRMNLIPTMFAKTSPVVLGEAANRYMLDPAVIDLIRYGRRIQQSSPKRFFSDMKKVSTGFWKMIPNDPANTDPELAANALYWMNEDNGSFVDRDKVPKAQRPPRNPPQAIYPRSATLVWMLIEILEKAWEQCNINSSDVQRYLQYALKNVIITYPSGWSCDEIALYKKLCATAVEIFERSTFGTSGQISNNINTKVDEAVASQLPYLFSEIHRLDDDATAWMSIAGKRGTDGRTTVRVMSFDIGGGTSDVSIVEYACTQAAGDDVVLNPTLLFKDGFSVAGDEMMRRIIVNVIFKSFDDCGYTLTDTRTLGDVLREAFSGSPLPDEKPKRSLHVKQCLVPLAIRIMSDMTSGSPSQIIYSNDVKAGITPAEWGEFGRFLGLYDSEDVPPEWQKVELKYDPKDVEAIIREDSLFGSCFGQIAKLAVKYDIDLFFMSGKTSEMPELKRMAKEIVPIAPNRIVSARDYDAGIWYPFSDSKNRIVDAKSVTAVGAALHHMLTMGQIDGWRMKELQVRMWDGNVWGRLDDLQRGRGERGDGGFSMRSDGSCVVDLRVGTKIGRKLLLSDGEESVYRFISTNGDTGIHKVKLVRTNAGTSEGLAIAAVDGKSASGFELAVDQLDDRTEEFWQDNGRLVYD